MELIEIFGTPVRIRECSLMAKVLLHFLFPMDRLEDAPFSIYLMVALKNLGVVSVAFLWERLFWQDVIEKELSLSVMQTVDLGK